VLALPAGGLSHLNLTGIIDCVGLSTATFEVTTMVKVTIINI
jgi:hypothetical protein